MIPQADPQQEMSFASLRQLSTILRNNKRVKETLTLFSAHLCLLAIIFSRYLNTLPNIVRLALPGCWNSDIRSILAGSVWGLASRCYEQQNPPETTSFVDNTRLFYLPSWVAFIL